MKRGDSGGPSDSQGLFDLHQTLDTVSTFLYVKDRERRVVSANRAFCAALGVTREDLLGQTTSALLGDAGPASDQVDREVLESGLPRLGFIESYPTSSGRRWVVTDKAPIRGPDDSVIGLLGASSDITEQVEAQQQLRQNEAQLRFLTGHMADILWTMDLGFHTTYVSPSVERILGFTPEERQRQTLEQMATPESVDRILSELRRQLDLEASGLADPERTITIEVEYYHRNGSTVWTENVVSPLRNADGVLTGIFGVSRDITARREAEQAAKESERLLHETEYLSHLGGWSYDPHTRLMAWTDGTFAVHEMDPTADIDRITDSLSCYAPGAHEMVEAAFRDAVERGVPYDLEVPFVTAKGRRRWVRTTGRPEVLHGTVLRVTGNIIDVTEQHEAAERLLASEEEYRQLFEQSVAAVLLVSREGRVLAANPAWHRMFGYSPEDLPSLRAERLYAEPDERSRFIATMARDGRLENDETRFRRKDGSVMVCLRSVSVRRSPDGAVAAYQTTFHDITALKQAELERRQSEQKYRQLFEQSVDAINLVAPDGRLLEANPAWYVLFGMSPDDAASFNAADAYVDPEGRSRFLRAIAAQEQVEDELQFRRKDGSVFDCRRIVTVRRSADGGIIGFQSVFHDITKRKRAEEALRRSEAQLRFLAAHTADVLWTMDLDLRTTYISPSVERLLGYTPEEWLQLPFDSMATPESVARERAELQRQLELEADGTVDPDRTLTIEVEMNHKNGSTLWMEMNIRAVRDEAGQLSGMVGVSRDISERKAARQALRESEQKYRALFELSQDAAYIASPDGYFLEVNQAWINLFGYSREEALHLPVTAIYEDPGLRHSLFLPLIERTGEVVDWEVRFKKKDAMVMDCLCSVVARRDDSGDVVRYQGIVRDVTEQKRAQQALKQSEERFRLVLNRSPATIAQVDRELRYVWIHHPHEDFAATTVVGKRDDELADNEGTRQMMQLKQQVLDSGEPARATITFPLSHGGRTYDIAAEPLKDDDGAVIGATTVAFDITERVQAEEALRASEERFRSLAEHLEDAVVRFDPSLRLVYANTAASILLRMPVVHPGTSLSELPLPGDMRELWQITLAEVFATASVRQGLCEFQSPLGPRYIDWQLIPEKDAHGGVTSVIASVRDVTELRQAQEQLRRLALRIQEAREEERSSVARELHDQFSQELTALKFDLKSLERTIEPGADVMRARIAAILKLVDGMSSEVRRVISELRPGMLDDLGLSAAIEWQAAHFSERSGMACDVQLDADDTMLPPDVSTALFRALQELLTNVARHSKASRVTISTASTPDSISLTVRDNGRGITDAELASPASLGLLGIYERIRACGGDVRIRGRRGRGTEAIITVPLQLDTQQWQARLGLG